MRRRLTIVLAGCALLVAAIVYAIARQSGGGRVFAVPPSIAGDCSKPVETEIMQWIRAVPDGSTLRFGHKRCYGQDASLVVADRSRLVLDGNGSTFKALTPSTPTRSNWRLQHDSEIALENMIIRGANPKPGVRGAHDYNGKDYSYQHGVAFEGVRHGVLDHVSVYSVYGDFVEAHYDPRNQQTGYLSGPSIDIRVRNGYFDGSGRQGMGLTDVSGFLLEKSYVGNVGQWAVDVETEHPRQYGRHIRIVDNKFGPLYFSVLANGGDGASPNVGDITITGNRMIAEPTTCWPPLYVQSPKGAYRSGYTVTGNHFVSEGHGVILTRASTARVSDNTVTFFSAACPHAGVSLKDSHRVVVEDNQFNIRLGLFTGPVEQDSASGQVTSARNKPASSKRVRSVQKP